MTTKRLCLFALAAAVAAASPLAAQVETEVPPVVAGAKPVAVERVKVHGASLEDNLEGNPADRDVLVFLPPGYERKRPGVIRSSTRCTDIDRRGTVDAARSTCRRPSRGRLPTARPR